MLAREVLTMLAVAMLSTGMAVTSATADPPDHVLRAAKYKHADVPILDNPVDGKQIGVGQVDNKVSAGCVSAMTKPPRQPTWIKVVDSTLKVTGHVKAESISWKGTLYPC